jgi:hypothetical protein
MTAAAKGEYDCPAAISLTALVCGEGGLPTRTAVLDISWTLAVIVGFPVSLASLEDNVKEKEDSSMAVTSSISFVLSISNLTSTFAACNIRRPRACDNYNLIYK